MSPDLLEYVSGRIPMGIWLIPLVGVIFSFIWEAVWHGTKFYDARRRRRVHLYGWLAVFSLYTAVWSVFAPPSIPRRVMLVIGEPGETSAGPSTEAVGDAVRTRIVSDRKRVSLIDVETTPSILSCKSKPALDSLALRMRVGTIVGVRSGLLPDRKEAVAITFEEASGSGYKMRGEKSAPVENLRATMLWAGQVTEQALGLREVKGEWSGMPKMVGDPALYQHFLAVGKRQLGELPVAAAFFLQEAAADSDWLAPRLELARTRFAGDPDPYEEEIGKALLEAANLDRENPETYLLLGRYFLEANRWDEAESALKLAYHYAPADPRVYFLLARLMPHRLEDLPLKTPERHLQRAVQIAPGYEIARLALVELYRKGHKKTLAEEEILKGLAVAPDSRAILLTASAVQIDLRKYGAAAAHLERLLASNPVDADALYNLGVCHLWLKDYRAAVAAFDSSFVNDGPVENLYYSGVALAKLNEYDAAIDRFQRRFAAATHADDRGALSARKWIYELRARKNAGDTLQSVAFPDTLQ